MAEKCGEQATFYPGEDGIDVRCVKDNGHDDGIHSDEVFYQWRSIRKDEE